MSAAHSIRLAEPNSDSARQGVSLQDQIRTMVMEAMAGLMPQAVPDVQVRTAPKQPAKPIKTQPKPVAVQAIAPRSPKAESTGKWWIDALSKTDRKTGAPYYSVDIDSAMVNGDVVILKSHKWAPVLMLIKGRRKPIYLKAFALASLIEASATIGKFASVNGDYLADSLDAGMEEE